MRGMLPQSRSGAAQASLWARARQRAGVQLDDIPGGDAGTMPWSHRHCPWNSVASMCLSLSR